MKELDLFYLQQEEPAKSCFLVLREHILNYNKNITETWKFRMPFFCCKGQSFCYFRINRKDGMPYVGFTEGKRMSHQALVSSDRVRIKILMVVPSEDLPAEVLDGILKEAIYLCETSL
jgi:hypothetical protein